MDPMRRVRSGIWALAAIAALAVPAHAQFYDDVLRGLGLGPDPLTVSPRLVGMGRLSLVVDDVHHRFDIWEFSHNPAALLDADSVSTFELYPSTTSNSVIHDDPSSDTSRESQDFALSEFHTGYEAWRRARTGSAFGIIGEFDRLRTDLPQTGSTELRTQFSVPRSALVLAGKMPLVASERVRYGISLGYRYESRTDETRGVVSNAAGDYIDQDGDQLQSPVSMVPTQYGVRSLGGRLGVLFRATPWLRVAGAYDYTSNSIEGTEDKERNTSEIREDRPYGTLSASIQGRIAGRLELVGDAAQWSAGRTDQRWVASFSTGSGQLPLTGRGMYQRRDETGHELRGRASWRQGAFTLSAGGTSFRREVTTYVPPVDDRTSFNYFLNSIYSTPGADSLALPDSVRANQSTETGDEYGAGVAYRLPWRSAVVGLEYHSGRSTFEQVLSGDGPDRKVWDVRTGIELPLNSVLQLRGGYIYRWLDQDELLSQNEYVSNAMTAGLGFGPEGSSWAFDAAYLKRWGKADFGDPTRLRSNEQMGLCRIRWVF